MNDGTGPGKPGEQLAGCNLAGPPGEQRLEVGELVERPYAGEDLQRRGVRRAVVRVPSASSPSARSSIAGSSVSARLAAASSAPIAWA